MTVTIPDDAAQALLTALLAATAPSSYGPGTVTWKSISPFGGPPYSITLTPSDGSAPSTFTVSAVPSTLQVAASASLPVSFSVSGGNITNVQCPAVQVQGALVLAITPNTGSTAFEIDFYQPASKTVLTLHVASVPAGMAAGNGKQYTFYYVPATAGGLDTIILSSLSTQ